MKKLVLILAVVAALVSFNACTKTCTCTTYVDGEKMGTAEGEVKGKCSELNTSSEVMGIKTEVKCE